MTLPVGQRGALSFSPLSRWLVARVLDDRSPANPSSGLSLCSAWHLQSRTTGSADVACPMDRPVWGWEKKGSVDLVFPPVFPFVPYHPTTLCTVCQVHALFTHSLPLSLSLSIFYFYGFLILIPCFNP